MHLYLLITRFESMNVIIIHRSLAPAMQLCEFTTVYTQILVLVCKKCNLSVLKLTTGGVNYRGGYCGWKRIAIRYDTARAYCNTYCNILGILCTVIFRLPKLMLCLFGARISFMMFKNCIIKSWVCDHLMMTFCLQSLGDCSCPVYLFFP